jgi:peptide methionine sulfoxide reductase MsrB
MEASCPARMTLQRAEDLARRGAAICFVMGLVALALGELGFVGSGGGGACQHPVTHNLQWGTAGDWDLAERICCHNTRYAEPSGYFQRVGFFGEVRAAVSGKSSVTFYDSQCGLPLFRAPIGRSMADWEAESRHHGWPSFREAEIIASNVVIHSGGEMASTCGTHLGHNLPDLSGDRYCIDLVCIAGAPAANASVVAVPGGSPSRPFGLADAGWLLLACALAGCLLAEAAPRLARRWRSRSKSGTEQAEWVLATEDGRARAPL